MHITCIVGGSWRALREPVQGEHAKCIEPNLQPSYSDQPRELQVLQLECKLTVEGTNWSFDWSALANTTVGVLEQIQQLKTSHVSGPGSDGVPGRAGPGRDVMGWSVLIPAHQSCSLESPDWLSAYGIADTVTVFPQYALYKKMTQAAILIQSKFRSYYEQKRFQQSRRAAVLIQQYYRSYKEYERLKQGQRGAAGHNPRLK